MSEYKKIVLLKGLEHMEDYHFRIIKSLLRTELELSEKMQKDYDRIKIADMMEETFPNDAGLNKLIEICQESKDLKGLVENLKAEKAKVKKPNKAKVKTAEKKTKQQLSSSQSLSTDNEPNKDKPSSKEKSEGGQKRKLTQEQTQLPEAPESNIQKDEGCLQTPHKPPPIPPSSSSNKKQKRTRIKNESTVKTEISQEEQQLLELSATSNSSAASELQNFQGLLTTASSSLQTPQKPSETCLALKMSQGSPAPPCQYFLVSPVLDSKIHLNSHLPLTLSSGVPALQVPSATASGNVPRLPSEMVSSSLSALQMSPVAVSSSAQNLHLLTSAAFNSMQVSHSPQAVASTSIQTTSGPSATLESKAWVIKMPPATASSSVQVPHALPEAVSRNVCTSQMPQRTTGSSIQLLNSATIKAPKNAQVPGPLATVPVHFPATLPSPATASSSLQASKVLPPSTSNIVSEPQLPIPILTSRAQTTQKHPGAPSNFIHAPHVPPLTVSRDICTTQVPQGVASSTGQALLCPKVKASRCALAPQMPSATTSESLLTPCTFPPTASKSLPALAVSPATAISALHDPLGSSATTSSSLCRTPRRRNIPKEPAKEEGQHQDPKEVMVLKVTEPFTYDLIDDKRMFHATVATENEFFRVKVFDPALKNKFIPNKIIAILNYFGSNGFLEIHQASCVSDVDNRTMLIPRALRQRANATPKIRDLFSQAQGTYVNGEFVVYKKTERDSFIYYGIEDDTGKMEVVVYGRLTNIKCEPGQKLRLVCFELSSREDTWQLKSIRHSFMQVINVRKKVPQA